MSEPTAPAAPEPLRALDVPMRRIVELGLVGWLIALGVILAVPALRTGERAWWPWCAVAGVAVGLIGYGYLRRGKGNVAGSR